MNECKYCFDHIYRVGRAEYRCTECNRDVTLELVLLLDIGQSYPVTHRKTEKGFEPL